MQKVIKKINSRSRNPDEHLSWVGLQLAFAMQTLKQQTSMNSDQNVHQRYSDIYRLRG
jgi:hypothetical protein